MILFSSKRKNLPPEGTFQSVCCDIVDLGLKETQYSTNKYPFVRIVFQIEEKNQYGNRYTVSRQFKLSSHPDSGLRQFLESWMDKTFTEADFAVGFNVENLIGENAVIEIAHVEVGENLYANIVAIAPTPSGSPFLYPEDYQRFCERNNYKDNSDFARGEE